jgi:hypothetical protein
MENKGLRVQSVVHPEKNLSFNEWAQQLNVSCLYDERPKQSGHYYPPIEIKKSFFKRLSIMFGITN